MNEVLREGENPGGQVGWGAHRSSVVFAGDTGRQWRVAEHWLRQITNGFVPGDRMPYVWLAPLLAAGAAAMRSAIARSARHAGDRVAALETVARHSIVAVPTLILDRIMNYIWYLKQERDLRLKPLRVSRDVIPIGKLKGQVSQLLRELGTSRRAVVITVNGEPAGVLISPEEFDRIQEQDRFFAAVSEGSSDVKAGRSVTDDELEEALDSRSGRRR